ncbi:MAG: hypothetical protein JXJ19_06095 [Elusimicrobia bacterium]|nr:hypothetical protein [Elusimicrobiota bacterium]
MTKATIKSYIVIFSSIFLLLSFVTWQQITIFRMGYRITKLREDLRIEEIRQQKILEDMQVCGSLSVIESRARGEFGMDIPESADNLIEVDGNRMLCRNKKSLYSYVADIKGIFAPDDAQAK